MRTFALTYPQLMNQAARLGLGEADRVRLADAHELAEGLLDGLYRKQGVPFVCHTTRTASIALEESLALDVAVASLLHAVYFLHTFERSSRRGPRRADRAQLRARIGAPAEALIERYTHLPWSDGATLRGYAERASEHRPELRRVLLMKLANELEDHLDAAAAYVEPGGAPRHAAEYVALAEALGHEQLAAELREAFEQCRGAEVEPALRARRAGSYQATRLWKANPIERLGSALRAARRRARGG